ncbi:hypothetical protein [Devosia sp.]|uniref:hypothetical protein n=1 Tax=Devosia sp. TaxID=1871048 RepID=UPI003A8FFA39
MTETNGERAPSSRSLALFLVTLALGPFFAGVSFVLILAAFAVMSGEDSFAAFGILGGLPVFVWVSYTFGLVPAALVGLALALMVRSVSSRRVKLPFAAVIGGGVTLVVMPIVVLVTTGRLDIADSLWLIVMSAVAGGLAALASTALVTFWPLDPVTEPSDPPAGSGL